MGAMGAAGFVTPNGCIIAAANLSKLLTSKPVSAGKRRDVIAEAASLGMASTSPA
jgi:hypothetical protein